MCNKDIKLVEYDVKYAKSIAEMWNNSSEGWNGFNSHRTEKSVIDREAVSSHLNLYLALIGEKVVGYCKLSKYYYDENTLYIDLLNVDPQYFNQKIGKALVKKAVARTIELNYPRLDLFTWAGNTKAVPLYKKCGFFWEKMESDSTHLMNFIPVVMQTPLLRDFFETADWYDDSTRSIVVEPDGRTENNFDFLTYTWEKEGQSLRVEFEKNGRGIHSIETDEFLIKTEIPNGKLVFGQKYEVKYHYTNKTDTAQKVRLKGMDNKNISFALQEDTELMGSKTFVGEFFLGSIDVEQSMWRTHPAVCSELSIDGKSALLKTGINPLFPLKLLAAKSEYQLFAGRAQEVFFNLENNFDRECRFEIRFPSHKDILFADGSLGFVLKAHERNSIPIMISASKSLIYNEEIDVRAVFDNGEDFRYRQTFSLTIYVSESKAWGETKRLNSIINSQNVLTLDREDNINEIVFKSLKNKFYWYQGFPKIGLPYSAEFQNKLPEKVEYSSDESSVTLKSYYSSDDFPGCEYVCHYKLLNSGMLEHYTELQAFPSGMDEVTLSRSFGFDGRQMTMPYSGMLIKIDDIMNNDSMMSYWDGEKIDENWFHCCTKNGNMSIVWHPDDKLRCCEWNYAIEHTYRKGESMLSNTLFIAFDVFPSIRRLREFALGKKVKEVVPKVFNELRLNNGNPFVDADKSNCELKYQDFRQKPLECSVQLSSMTCKDFMATASANKEEAKHQLSFGFPLQGEHKLDLIRAKAIYPTKSFEVEKFVFIKQMGETMQFVEKLGENTVYTVDNGSIRFKASPEFAPSIFSMIYDSHEWIDSSFPLRGAKSWWNPWCGGLENILDIVKRSSWFTEKHLVSFVEKQDSYHQTWQGIEIKTTVEHTDSLKGLIVCQYYLVLPGLPVLATYSSYQQEAGFTKTIRGFSRIFFKADDEIKNSEFELYHEDKVLSTKCGIEEIEFDIAGKLLACRGIDRKERLYFYSTQAPVNAYAGSDLSVSSLLFNHEIDLKNNELRTSELKFIILSELPIPVKALIDLDNIVFD